MSCNRCTSRDRRFLLLSLGISVCLFVTAEESRGENKPAGPVFVDIPARGQVRFETTAKEEKVPARFHLAAHTFPFTCEFKRMSGPVRVYDVTFPSPVKTKVEANNTVHGHYYQPAGDGPFPACVCLHILGGGFELSEMSANSLARQGIAALTIKMPYYAQRRGVGENGRRRMISFVPEHTAEGMTQAVLDVRRAAAWLANRDEVNSQKLGVTGISLGGIMSALSSAAEPRFKKVAIYLGGGNLALGIWENPHPHAKQFRKQWLQNGGTYESFLKIMSPVDPHTYGHLLEDRDVLMVVAKHDEILPPKSSIALWESIGKKPELVWLDSGHITAAMYIFGETRRLTTFFSNWE
ncbi:alpha/beta hydrolase family protein [uncultured Gimesia sp.]|uniref:alpha/beta hydrolase family protein n=1 Tax=uncultured Gimesia sp. TaxID=1678688 RepID=UPI00261DF29C|nr:alpha/beta hydrolase family protein [uncultured Gimesia sp.]